MPLRSVGCAPDSANVKPEPSLAIERLLSLFGDVGYHSIAVIAIGAISTRQRPTAFGGDAPQSQCFDEFKTLHH